MESGLSIKVLIPATIGGLILIAVFCVGMWYINSKIDIGRSYADLKSQLASVLGVSLLGSIALIIALVLLSIQWSSIENSAYLALLISTIALLCSSSAMTISGVTH